MVGIGLTDLPNIGGEQWPLCPPPPVQCVEWDFMRTFLGNQDAEVELIFIKFC